MREVRWNVSVTPGFGCVRGRARATAIVHVLSYSPTCLLCDVRQSIEAMDMPWHINILWTEWCCSNLYIPH